MTQGTLTEAEANTRIEKITTRLAQLENGLAHLESAIPAMRREAADLRRIVEGGAVHDA